MTALATEELEALLEAYPLDSGLNGRIIHRLASALLAEREAMDVLRVELNLVRSGRVWRNINTAPKDGRKILIYSHDCPEGVMRASWCDTVGAWRSGAAIIEEFQCQWPNTIDGKTKWMPLPAPPKGEA